MNQALCDLAETFSIPIIPEKQKIWFLRTKQGLYYCDFKYNNYVALGWDKVSLNLINDKNIDNAAKKDIIAQLYSNETRPGLILSQLDTFYKKMNPGDIIVIPSLGTKWILIGEICEIVGEITHKNMGAEYPECGFIHKRSVKWLKEIEIKQDIYLFKALRAQQTISDLTYYSNLIYRNLFNTYIDKDAIHLTVYKHTHKELNLSHNIDFLASIRELIDETTKLYGGQSVKEQITIKTAVSSPGFMEFVIPLLDGMTIPSIVLAVKLLMGKTASNDGKTLSSGLLGTLTEINNIIDAKANRKKVHAEEYKILADAEFVKAQTDRERAEARRINAEAERIEIENEIKRREIEDFSIPTQSQINAALPSMAEQGERLINAAEQNDIILPA